MLDVQEGNTLDTAASRRVRAFAALVLTSTLSACGGGGGGGSSTPAPLNAPPVGTNPAPISSSAGTPATPNPAGTTPNPAGPTPTPPVNPGTPPSSPTPPPSGSTQTPGTPTPQPSTQGNTILPNTTGRFSLMQMADEYGYGNASLTASQIQAEAPYYDSVWAAFQPETWASAPGSTVRILSRYVIPFEDMYLISGNNLSYFQQNHPDWIMYGCDSSGNPTQHYAWSGSGFPNDVPLNIHNSAVVTYQMNLLAGYLQANGYNAVAIDQVAFVNFLSSPNPELEGQGPTSGWYGCGVYTQGPQNPSSFQRVYGSQGNSDLDVADQAFINDELNWVSTAKSQLGALGIKVLINHPPVGPTPSGNEATLLSYVDGVIDENGFTNYGQYGPDLRNPGNFTETLSWVQAVQGMGKAVFLADYYTCQYDAQNCPATSVTSATQLSDAESDWALSTYAIANSGGLGLFVAPQGVGEYSYRPEFSKTYGAPCGAYTQSGSVFTRQFQNGFAVVDASTSPATVTLPSGNTYTDIATGAQASGSLSLAPSTGSMLQLTSGTGCNASGGSTIRRGGTLRLR